MNRHIVCFTIPTFQVALARLEEASLTTRPVAVALSSNPRSVITEASKEARRDGIVTNMSVAQARRLCPSLHVRSPRPDRIRQANRALLRVVERFTPIWESVQPGHFYLDLTGTTRLFGPACDTAMRMRQEIARQYRLSGMAGIGNSKLVSYMASTLVEPPQLCDIRSGSEEAFLAPLPVDTLPLTAASRKTILMRLDDVNVRTLGEIARIPLADLVPVLGQHATLLHAWARGIDPSRVLPPARQPGVEATLNLEPGELDSNRLPSLLYRLLEYICRELRRQQRQCHELTIRLQYGDNVEVEHSQPVHPGTLWEVDLMPCVSRLFVRCFRRRIRVRTLTVRAGHPLPVAEQLTLFGWDNQASSMASRPACRLALAMDTLRVRFGHGVIGWGKAQPDAGVRSSSRTF
ncbi:MAG: hypothetical protein AB7P17_00045 [Nitrospirales bacterium]|nr:hypothetical protein [Nitrospirales bacterium]